MNPGDFLGTRLTGVPMFLPMLRPIKAILERQDRHLKRVLYSARCQRTHRASLRPVYGYIRPRKYTDPDHQAKRDAVIALVIPFPLIGFP